MSEGFGVLSWAAEFLGLDIGVETAGGVLVSCPLGLEVGIETGSVLVSCPSELEVGTETAGGVLVSCPLGLEVEESPGGLANLLVLVLEIDGNIGVEIGFEGMVRDKEGIEIDGSTDGIVGRDIDTLRLIDSAGDDLGGVDGGDWVDEATLGGVVDGTDELVVTP